MVTRKANRKDYFDINSLIAKGKADVREFSLPLGKVLYRPLSQLEVQSAEAAMLASIKDIPTREYLFNKAEENSLEDFKDVEEEEEESKSRVIDFPPEVNIAEFYNALTVRDIKVVALSIRDFTDSFDEQDLMKLDGIKELADEILRISGNSQESKSEIENFR